MPISPSLIGTLACAIMIIFWLMKGRKNDLQSLLTVFFGCVAIFLLVSNWNTVVHYSDVLLFHSSSHSAETTAAQVAPTHVPTHVVLHKPTPVPHHVPPAGHPTVSKGQKPAQESATHSATPSSPSLVGQLLEGLVPILYVALIAILVGLLVAAANKRIVGYSARSNGRCPVCGQRGPIQEVSWNEGPITHTRTMCHDCAARQRAAATAS